MSILRIETANKISFTLEILYNAMHPLAQAGDLPRATHIHASARHRRGVIGVKVTLLLGNVHGGRSAPSFEVPYRAAKRRE